MYVFNRITVNPQLPKRIGRITEIANNLWWSWNTDFLRLFKMIDMDLWERCNKNPVKFLKSVDQERLENASKDLTFIKEYDKIVDNFDGYMNSKNTWFNQKHPFNSIFFSRIWIRPNNRNIFRRTWNIIRRSFKICK